MWTSRLGHAYLVRPLPIIEPLPDPIPRHGPAPPPPVPRVDDLNESDIWEDISSEANTGSSPEPPPQSDTHGETPPF